MIQLEKKESCCGCKACAQACPVSCITMQIDSEGFWYPKVDMEKCIQCGLCERVCPMLAAKESSKEQPKAYAAYNLDEEVRLDSSSGGVFSLLAEQVLDRNGTVYGAALSEQNRVEHIRISEPEEQYRLRGSKYVQSDIGDTFIQAKKDLGAGLPVLFTGTPCQIEGLRAFLGRDYENLICMDIICHGVPSPMVWSKYREYQEAMIGEEIAEVSFRDKYYGWKNFSMSFLGANNVRTVIAHEEDLFMQAFLRNVCLRPSCYDCKYKTINRISDITVADFWGIQDLYPELDDDNGISLVIVHSNKGDALMEELSCKMRCREVDLYEAVARNSAMLHSVRKPKTRDMFMQNVVNEPFVQVITKYAVEQKSIKSRIKSILIKLHLWKVASAIKQKLENREKR